MLVVGSFFIIFTVGAIASESPAAPVAGDGAAAPADLVLAASQGMQITVSEILISGVAEAEQAYVRSILAIAEGDVFCSLAELKRKASVLESYLAQDGGYSNVSIEVEEDSDTEATVYVLLQGAMIGALPVFGS